VPVENVLGEIGKGHKIAFQHFKHWPPEIVLQHCWRRQACRYRIGEYANTREQFKTPIASFGAIKHKLAEMVIKPLHRKVRCTARPNGSMKKNRNCWSAASRSTKPYWVLPKNTLLNAPS
jgi:hypothetical protein